MVFADQKHIENQEIEKFDSKNVLFTFKNPEFLSYSIPSDLCAVRNIQSFIALTHNCV